MTFESTAKTMSKLLSALTLDLEKAVHGNKAASQRVRTGTIKLEKAAKMYRKLSIKAEKSGVFKKAKKAKAAKVKKAPAKKKAKAPAKKKAKAKPKAAKRKTAKIPAKKKKGRR
jgi:hypothetical protein